MNLTNHQILEVERLTYLCLAPETIAVLIGVKPADFARVAAAYPDVSNAINRGRARAEAMLAEQLMTLARAGDTAAVRFLLERRNGWTRLAAPAPPGPVSAATVDQADIARRLERQRRLLDEDFGEAAPRPPAAAPPAAPPAAAPPPPPPAAASERKPYAGRKRGRKPRNPAA